MTKPIERDPIYRGRRFQTETIELCVRWYITYRLSYRVAHDDHALGLTIRPGVRKALGSLSASSEFFLAHG